MDYGAITRADFCGRYRARYRARHRPNQSVRVIGQIGLFLPQPDGCQPDQKLADNVWYLVGPISRSGRFLPARRLALISPPVRLMSFYTFFQKILSYYKKNDILVIRKLKRVFWYQTRIVYFVNWGFNMKILDGLLFVSLSFLSFDLAS